MRLLSLLSLLGIFANIYGFPQPSGFNSTSRYKRKSPAKKKQFGISDAAAYLGKYGYLSRSKSSAMEAGSLVDSKAFYESVARLQEMLALPVTGKLDPVTIETIQMPRCGVEDTLGVSQLMSKGNYAKSKFRNKKMQRKENKRQKKRKGKGRKKGKRGNTKVERKRRDLGELKLNVEIEDGLLLGETPQYDELTGELNDVRIDDGGLVDESDVPKIRKRRYNLEGSKWSKTDLTYKIHNYTPDMNKYQVDQSIRDALKLWSDQTPLTFRQVTGKADINIKFGRSNHGDYYPFDGPGGTLAHAFFPQSGETHFDEDEDYDYKDGNGVNLMIVAAHEFGHSLGLAHSNVPGSLMAPVYQGYVENYKLDRDDIVAIQQIYGKKYTQTTTTRPTTTKRTTTRRTTTKRTTTKRPNNGQTTKRPPSTPKPTSKPNEKAMDICKENFKFNATFYDPEYKIMYAFGGKYYWAFDGEGRFQEPQLITRRWEKAPESIDAAAYSIVTKRTYFFKDEKIYRYSKFKLDGGFPRPTKHLGLPKKIDAAMQFAGDGLIYVFKKKNFFRFDEYQAYDGIQRYSHRRIEKSWDNVPNDLDAAMQWQDGATYFLKGDFVYKFSYDTMDVEKGFPKNLKRYFIKCPRQKSAPLKYRKRKNKGKGKKKNKKDENKNDKNNKNN